MQVYELVIEITRKCNLKCEHCMRGTAQHKNIAFETIDKLLEGVDCISTVTFSGGEPSLNVPAIRYFTKAVKARGVTVGGFYVITNGKVASLDLVHALMDLYAYIDPYERNDTCGLIVSQDQYHRVLRDPTEAINLYSSLSFFHPEARANKIDPYLVIAEGNAKDWGGRTAPLNNIVVELDDDGEVGVIEDTVYVNALGDVIPSCDLSFKSQEKAKIGNVHNETLAQIFKRQAPKDEELKEAA